MQDEHFMRQWNESHDAFSAGVTHTAEAFQRDAVRPGARYDQANRIFVAIVAGMLAGVAVSTVATADTIVVAHAAPAPILA